MMYTPRFQGYIDTLRTLYTSRKPSVRAGILSEAGSGLVNAISEITLNIVKGVLPVSKRTLTKLRKWKSQVKDLASKKTSLKAKKQLLTDNRELIRIILRPLIDILVSVDRSKTNGKQSK